MKGKWCYLYRAIDQAGNLVDTMLSRKRTLEAAKKFFRRARAALGHSPDKVTTDGLASYPRAVKEGLGSEVEHPSNRYLNNLIEQDHRGIKQRYYRMLGFKSFDCAAVFCPVFDELRNFFRFRKEVGGEISLAERRRIHLERVAAFNVLMGIS